MLALRVFHFFHFLGKIEKGAAANGAFSCFSGSKHKRRQSLNPPAGVFDFRYLIDLRAATARSSS
jgi:hypothetical protein